jgi:hypothetical protein
MFDDSKQMAREFLQTARAEIKKGGDYRDRLLHSEEFRRLSSLFSNAPDLIAKAEAEADAVGFVMAEMGREYGHLRDHVWQQHNFDHPYYRKGDLLFDGAAPVIDTIKGRFPQMASRLTAEELRTCYVRAAYHWDGGFKADWEGRYGPIKRIEKPGQRGASN